MRVGEISPEDSSESHLESLEKFSQERISDFYKFCGASKKFHIT